MKYMAFYSKIQASFKPIINRVLQVKKKGKVLFIIKNVPYLFQTVRGIDSCSMITLLILTMPKRKEVTEIPSKLWFLEWQQQKKKRKKEKK